MEKPIYLFCLFPDQLNVILFRADAAAKGDHFRVKDAL